MVYVSFKNSKNKIQKLWEQNEENTSDINNKLQVLNVNFKSVNFLKEINTLPIIVISNKDQEELNELNEQGFKNELEKLKDKLEKQGSSIFTEAILGKVIQNNLNNFPEWIINHINILPIIEIIGDINDDIIYNDLTPPAEAGILKIGDILFTDNSISWIVKLSENNYLLKIVLNINIRIVTSVNIPEQGNFNTNALPFTLNLNLKILNPRIYENSRIQKK